MGPGNPHPVDNGMTKNPNPLGRPKGSPNKNTAEIRECLKYMVEKQLDKVEEAFNRVYEKDPTKFLSLYTRFCEMVLPKQQAIELTNTPTVDIEASIQMMKESLGVSK